MNWRSPDPYRWKLRFAVFPCRMGDDQWIWFEPYSVRVLGPAESLEYLRREGPDFMAITVFREYVWRTGRGVKLTRCLIAPMSIPVSWWVRPAAHLRVVK
jgi:hypothetical protein